jgi:hypothetical protein
MKKPGERKSKFEIEIMGKGCLSLNQHIYRVEGIEKKK